jgi:hypothetical protein
MDIFVLKNLLSAHLLEENFLLKKEKLFPLKGSIETTEYKNYSIENYIFKLNYIIFIMI